MNLLIIKIKKEQGRITSDLPRHTLLLQWDI
jgi:hypothetical protein